MYKQLDKLYFEYFQLISKLLFESSWKPDYVAAVLMIKEAVKGKVFVQTADVHMWQQSFSLRMLSRSVYGKSWA